jgi:hypothetical protein
MKHAIGVLTLSLLLLAGNAHAVTVTQTITNVSVHNGVYTFEVWGSSSQNGAPYLFSANYEFYVTPGAVSPGSLTLGPLFNGWGSILEALNDSTIRVYLGSGTSSYVFLQRALSRLRRYH